MSKSNNDTTANGVTKQSINEFDSGVSFRWGKLFFTLFFAFSIITIAFNGVDLFPDVTSILELFANAPLVDMDWFKTISDTNLVIGADWGAFNFFRDFLNSITKGFSFTVWLGTGIVNAVIFLSYFIFKIFGF